MREKRNTYKVLGGKLKERDHLGSLGINNKMHLK
jgi:hypothetical protein